MTIHEFYWTYGLEATVSVLSGIYAECDSANYFSNHLKYYLSNKNLIIPDIPTRSQVVRIMAKVNKEVKHPDCPNNYRNRFYKFKTKLIKLWLKQGAVSKITESEKHYCFTIEGYSFHQLKGSYLNKVPFYLKYKKYIPTEDAIPFSIEDFGVFKIAAALTLATSSGSRRKPIPEPIR